MTVAFNMNRYEEIETFVRTVEAGSFTAASDQLGVTKSVVSRRVADLEKRLGVQLLARTTRKLNLTEEGQALYDRALRLLTDWEEAEASVGRQQTALKGGIRMSLPLSFGHVHIGPAILEFQRHHPDVSLDIEFTDRKVDLIAEGFDLAVRIGELSDSTMIARKLTAISTTVVASPEYLKRNGVPKTPDDLNTHRELRFALRSRKSWTYVDKNGSTGEIEMQSTIRANSGDFLCEAASENVGIAILPRFIVYPALLNGNLVEVLTEYRWGTLNAHVLYPSSRHLPLRVRELIDYLIASCGDGTPVWDRPVA